MSYDKSIWWQMLLWSSIWFLIPFVIGGFEMHGRSLERTYIIIPAIAICVFINLIYLLPTFYFKKKYILYTLLALSLIVIFVLLLNYEAMPWAEYFNSRSRGSRRGGSSYKAFRYISQGTPLLIAIIGSGFISIARDAIKKENEMTLLKSEKLESELKFLKSQTNPHFLFNALNNIYSLAVNKSDATPDNLLKLSDMLRYMLYDCKADKVPLKKEIEYISNFVDLYKLKDESELNIDLHIEANEHLMVAPLMFIPFIENAFKHSNIEDLDAGWIRIQLQSEGKQVHFHISNSTPQKVIQKDQIGGIGLKNIKRQLELLYPEKHDLDIRQTNAQFSVNLNFQGI
ncbi:MAG: histidine kinase [Bacteroidota bacterium]